MIVEELFHPDSGWADYNCVFLNPNSPSDAMKKLLKTSQHSHRLLYLQGSWASQQVGGARGAWSSKLRLMLKTRGADVRASWQGIASCSCHTLMRVCCGGAMLCACAFVDAQDLVRTQVEACDAVFVLCDKAPEDAKQEDLQSVMACLAIGTYIQVGRCTSTCRPAVVWHVVVCTCSTRRASRTYVTAHQIAQIAAPRRAAQAQGALQAGTQAAAAAHCGGRQAAADEVPQGATNCWWWC